MPINCSLTCANTGDNGSHIILLGKAGAPTALVRLLKEGSGHSLTAASSLLLALTRGTAGEANAAAAAAAEGAVAVLLRLLKSGEEAVRVAAAGVVGVLARRSAQDRCACSTWHSIRSHDVQVSLAIGLNTSGLYLFGHDCCGADAVT